MLYQEMAQFASIMPKELDFPSYRAMSEGDVRPGPIQDAQRDFFRALKGAGLKPDAASVTGWDPLMIVLSAFGASRARRDRATRSTSTSNFTRLRRRERPVRLPRRRSARHRLPSDRRRSLGSGKEIFHRVEQTRRRTKVTRAYRNRHDPLALTRGCADVYRCRFFFLPPSSARRP